MVDAGLQKVQTVLSKALVPVMRMISDIGEGVSKTKKVEDYLTPLSDAARLGSAAFSLLSQSRKHNS